MATASEKCARITGALGDLAEQEAVSLAQEDLPAVLTIQDRAAPLVAFLADHLPALSGSEAERVRSALAEIFDRRARTAALLDDKLSGLRGAMADTVAARGRAARVAPVYGSRRSSTTARQLLAQG